MTSRKEFNSHPLWRVFHHSSSNTVEELLADASSDSIQHRISYSSTPGAETIDIATCDQESQLTDVIQNRRSPKKFLNKKITRNDIAALVDGAAGITVKGKNKNFHRRAYPSGGALYPIEVYAVVLNGVGIDSGLYHYNVQDRTLERLVSGQLRDELEFLATDLIDTSPLCLFLTAHLERTTQKYGDRGYRYALMEAGHVMQNICLIAENNDLGCRPIAGFAEAAADDFLRCNVTETCLYAGLIGVPQQDSN